MIPSTLSARRLARALSAAALAAAMGSWSVLGACSLGEQTAGGSSEVDNPVVLAMVDSSGVRVSVTGSLSLYLADQSPVLNPSPRLEIRLMGVDSVVLTPAILAAAGLADSLRTFNLHLESDDSTGSFVRGLVYDPATRRFAREDGLVASVNLTVAPLLRTESVIKGGAPDTTGVNRVIIPGSPFQAVLVDSVFVFEGIPPGVFPVHVVTPDGSELPLPEPVDTHEPKYHRMNPDTTPVPRPAPPVAALSVNAGADRTVFAGAEVALIGQLGGVNPSDKRISVLWKQLPSTNPGSGTALIERPTRLETKVYFPRAGAYNFVLTAVIGNQQVTDTVTVGVQAPSETPLFIEPGAGDTLYMFDWNRIVWQGMRNETLNLELSQDGGATWQAQPIIAGIASKSGFNERYWQPVSPWVQASANNLMRLRNLLGETVATTPVFTIDYYPLPRR